jgi:lysyl-tRNA synthetase class 2
MLEWYRTGADYRAVMEDCEKLFTQILGNKLQYQGENYDLSLPWPRISVSEVFNGKIPRDEDFHKAFFNEVEPKLAASHKPAIIYDYPASQASLARVRNGFAERFEVFLAGVELGNCFSELIDWQEQKARFEKDMAERKKQNKTEYPIDEDFIEALKSGLPEVSGIAVGVDRLVMLAADVPTVADTLFFPGRELFDI